MSSYVTKTTPGDTSWFVYDRFGMFIHWGLYAMPARNEWVKHIESMSEEKYDLYFKYFNPDLFDPENWAKQAFEAGMKYVVITTKHHDGFCMFDSQYTDYKCTNTKIKKDLLGEIISAFRKYNIRVGLYYSLIDWHHPDFTLDPIHPRRNDPNARELNAGRDMKRYCEYMRNQVKELLTNYGKIDIMWFDYSYSEQHNPNSPCPWGKGKDDWEAEKLFETVRSINPDIIINNRAGIDQDIWTPEQYQPDRWQTHPLTGEKVVWEACHTFSGSWGYYRDETTWKTPEQLIKMLIKTVALGGNFIMNVGPTARGYIDARAEKSLAVYRDWMKYNGRSIYGCTMAEPEFEAPHGCVLTQSIDEKKLYIHLFDYPYQFLELHHMSGKIEYAQFLHDDSEIKFRNGTSETNHLKAEEAEDSVVLSIPTMRPDVLVPVIELMLK